MSKTNAVSLIGFPYHFARPPEPTGYQMARCPEVLLAPDAVPAQVAEWCEDVEVEMVSADEPVGRPGEPSLPPGDQMMRTQYQNLVLGRRVRSARERDRLPVVFAGGCNSGVGVVAGLADPGMGLFWFDAHNDAETPEISTTGLFEGMPVATIAGRCWQQWAREIDGFAPLPEERIAQIGLHDVHIFGHDGSPYQGIGALVDPAAVAQHGFEGAFEIALRRVSAGTDRAYVHLDVDVLDPAFVRGNHHTAPGGPSPARVQWAVERIAAEMEILAVTIASYDVAVDENAPSVLVPLANELIRTATRG